jgi:5-methylcytosine-specific restriction protein B
MSLNDEVQEYVRTTYVASAKQRGDTTVRIKAGDVHRSLHWSNRVPSVCTTLASQKFQKETGLKLISKQGPPSGYSTTVVYTYNLGLDEPKPSTSGKPRLEALYGLLAGVYRELGGGERYLREEREQLQFRKEADRKKDKA